MFPLCLGDIDAHYQVCINVLELPEDNLFVKMSYMQKVGGFISCPSLLFLSLCTSLLIRLDSPVPLVVKETTAAHAGRGWGGGAFGGSDMKCWIKHRLH